MRILRGAQQQSKIVYAGIGSHLWLTHDDPDPRLILTFSVSSTTSQTAGLIGFRGESQIPSRVSQQRYLCHVIILILKTAHVL